MPLFDISGGFLGFGPQCFSSTLLLGATFYWGGKGGICAFGEGSFWRLWVIFLVSWRMLGLRLLKKPGKKRADQEAEGKRQECFALRHFPVKGVVEGLPFGRWATLATKGLWDTWTPWGSNWQFWTRLDRSASGAAPNDGSRAAQRKKKRAAVGCGVFTAGQWRRTPQVLRNRDRSFGVYEVLMTNTDLSIYPSFVHSFLPSISLSIDWSIYRYIHSSIKSSNVSSILSTYKSSHPYIYLPINHSFIRSFDHSITWNTHFLSWRVWPRGFASWK